MSENHYSKDQVDTMQAVLDMVEAQESYFRQPNNHRLKIAKAKEQRVRQILTLYIKAGVIRSSKPDTTNQLTML